MTRKAFDQCRHGWVHDDGAFEPVSLPPPVARPDPVRKPFKGPTPAEKAVDLLVSIIFAVSLAYLWVHR